LQSGREIHIDRHEVSEGTVRLYSGAGVIELPEAVILSYAPDEPLPPAPPATPVAPAVPNSKEKEIEKDPRALVRGAAVRAGLPPAFVESVAKTESALNPRAVSPKGALGVMQLMPDTAKALGADPNDLEQNIDAGTRLLRELLIRYNGDVVKALAAYNAGSAAVDRYNGLPPYAETQNYVNKVIQGYLDSKPVAK
jgi:soluble lytic murein transglycosylase-like protein